MRRRLGLVRVLTLIAATVGPAEQASVSLVASVVSTDGGDVDVIVENQGDGDAWVSDIRVQGTAWRLVEAWQPVTLSAGESLTVAVGLDSQADPEDGQLVIQADGASVPAAGCHPGVQVASDSVSVPLLGEAPDDCDADSDGVVAVSCGGDDCDDANADIGPTVAERCNGVDDNCDGLVDDRGSEDESEFFVDADGDGFGQPDVSVWACIAPERMVPNALDCDDWNPLVSPSAEETCNHVDDNCDGEVDEPGSLGEQEYFVDRDADGFGGDVSAGWACTAPPSTRTNSLDCNDDDVRIRPGAEEVCNDVDDNCDGSVDEEAIDAIAFYEDADTDGFGAVLEAGRACAIPSGMLVDGADCDDSDPLVNPSGVETCNGTDDDCDGDVDEGLRRLLYPDGDGDGSGRSTASPLPTCGPIAGMVENDWDCADGDATTTDCACFVAGPDGFVGSKEFFVDGYVDGEAVLTGSPGAFGEAALLTDTNGDGCSEVVIAGAGDVWVFAGPVVGEQSTDDALATLHGEDASFGTVMSAGDFNADGLMDLVVAAPSAGAVYRFDGPLIGDITVDSASAVFTSQHAAGGLGTSVAVGDLDADGRVDLVLGEPFDPTADGSAWVFYGPVSGSHLVSVRADVAIQGGSAGTSIALVGDVTGNGQPDLVVGGTPSERQPAFEGVDQRGAVGLYSGPLNGDLMHPVQATRSWLSDTFSLGQPAGTAAGYAAIAAGDTNGDGVADFVASAPEPASFLYSSTGPFGAFGLFFGATSPEAVAPSRMVVGRASRRGPGYRLASAGDVDGDGLSDFMATRAGTFGCDHIGGSVSLILGSSTRGPGDSVSPFWTRSSWQEDAEVGAGFAAGDTNADGLSDIVVSAPGAGEARVYLGAPRALPADPLPWTGIGLCMEGPESSALYPLAMGESLLVQGTIVEATTVVLPDPSAGGFNDCTASHNTLVAAAEAANGDIWAVYGTAARPNADLNIGAPFSVGYSGREFLGGDCGEGETAAFADSRGILYAASTSGWVRNPLSALLNVAGACLNNGHDGQSRIVVEGQPLRWEGSTVIEIPGGRAVANGSAQRNGGTFACQSETFQVARDPSVLPL